MQDLTANSKLYMPPRLQPVIAAVQIVHDLSEHQGRYEKFAALLAADGFAVVTSDLIGHGNHVRREADLGYIGDHGTSNIVGEIHENTRLIKERFPDVPYILVGHGLGALLATIYFKKYDYFLNGLVLTGMYGETGMTFNRLICNALMALHGDYYRSPYFYNKFYGIYTKAFSREGSHAAWLSSDKKVQSEFESDFRCGFKYTLNGWQTIFDIFDDAYENGSWIQKNIHIPIRILSGDKDVVSGSKNKLSHIADMFDDHGYDNIKIELLRGLRHDIYNDIGFERFYDYLINFCDDLAKFR